MLILSRRVSETIVVTIGGTPMHIMLTAIDRKHPCAHIGIDAPREWAIHRGESPVARQEDIHDQRA